MIPIYIKENESGQFEIFNQRSMKLIGICDDHKDIDAFVLEKTGKKVSIKVWESPQ